MVDVVPALVMAVSHIRLTMVPTTRLTVVPTTRLTMVLTTRLTSDSILDQCSTQNNLEYVMFYDIYKQYRVVVVFSMTRPLKLAYTIFPRIFFISMLTV